MQLRGVTVTGKILVCALAIGLFAWPLAAQQTPPEQAPPPNQQTGPNEPASPGLQSMPETPEPQAAPMPAPPPFPPMPRARPSHRWVNVGSVHHASHARRHTTRAHHRSTRASRRHRHAAVHRAPQHFSARTIRQCHRMSYRQIMRHDSCRTLMRRDLAAAAARHRHHTAHRHRRTVHRSHHVSRRHRR